MRQLLPVVVLVGTVSLVIGCDSLDIVSQEHYSEYTLTETNVLKRPWFRRDKPTNLEPVYCYKTLVELECFENARPGDERPSVWTYKAVRE